MVRAPLGGRRVRGYVVELGRRDPAGLKPLAGISGELSVFGPKLRDALIWASHHYVAPVSVVLERAAPPNLPSQPAIPVRSQLSLEPLPGHPMGDVVRSVLAGKRNPVTALMASWGDWDWVTAAASLAAAGVSVLVLVPTATELEIVAERAKQHLGSERVVRASGDLDQAEMTRSWELAAAAPGCMVLGTPRVATWPIAGLGLAIVLEEGRRAMKDRQTPTLSVRRLITTRGRLEGFAQVYVGPTPSLELLAGGAEPVQIGPRVWPLVEVVDRTEEPPGSGLITARTRAAIAGMLEREGRVFLFTHRRGYAPAYRCATCRELRRCPGCGSRPEPGEACPRCGEPARPCQICGGSTFEPLGAGVGRVLSEARNLFGDKAGEAGAERPMTVGSERDLAGLGFVDLAVAVDVDGLAFGTHFRASEEALRILARLAGRVGRGRGRRLMLQTSLPDQALVVALRRGNPIDFLSEELALRSQYGYPPATEMMVVETRGDDGDVDGDLRRAADESVSIMGPAATPRSHRWLIQGRLGGYKLALRPLIQRWRDSEITVRIDADPIDL